MNEPTSKILKGSRGFFPSIIILLVLGGCEVSQASPGNREEKIFSFGVALVMLATVGFLSARKRALSPQNPRLSPLTLLGLTGVVVIIAVLHALLKSGASASSRPESAPATSPSHFGDLILLAGALFVTLYAYVFWPLARRDRVDSATIRRLKWLGPVSLVIGLLRYFYHSRS